MQRNNWDARHCAIGDAITIKNNNSILIIDDIDYANNHYIAHYLSNPEITEVKVQFTECKLMAISE